MKFIVYPKSYTPDFPIFSASAREVSQNLMRTKSSNIWGYMMDIADRHDKTGTLYIQFKNKHGGPGDVYCYYDVPIMIYRKFVGALSKGHFFWMYIRNNFKYSKLTGNKRGVYPNAVN
jgi:hypothetical protein